MFEEPDICMDDLLAILSIEKICYDHTGVCSATPLDSDYLWETSYEALNDAASYTENGSLEAWDTYVQKFRFSGMRRYYDLCREYGRKHLIAFKNNRFVKEAADFVSDEMNGINSYCIDWMLFTPQKETEKRWPCLAIFTSPEFYQPAQLVESVYNIRSFYEEGVKRLEEELSNQKTQKEKITRLPAALPEVERSTTA